MVARPRPFPPLSITGVELATPLDPPRGLGCVGGSFGIPPARSSPGGLGEGGGCAAALPLWFPLSCTALRAATSPRPCAPLPAHGHTPACPPLATRPLPCPPASHPPRAPPPAVRGLPSVVRGGGRGRARCCGGCFGLPSPIIPSRVMLAARLMSGRLPA